MLQAKKKPVRVSLHNVAECIVVPTLQVPAEAVAHSVAILLHIDVDGHQQGLRALGHDLGVFAVEHSAQRQGNEKETFRPRAAH